MDNETNDVIDDVETIDDEDVAPWYSGDDDEGNADVLNDLAEVVDDEKVVDDETIDEVDEVVETDEDKLVSEMELSDELDVVSQEILDGDYADKFKEAVAEMPEDFVAEMSGSPADIRGLAVDIESGVYDKVAPHIEAVMKQGKSYREAYGFIYSALLRKEENKEAAKGKRELLKAEPSTNPVLAPKRPQDMNDAEFDKYWDEM